jgi:hypothetical protein
MQRLECGSLLVDLCNNRDMDCATEAAVENYLQTDIDSAFSTQLAEWIGAGWRGKYVMRA